ncbi:hypothetical protein HBI56_154420 [Parastagonospora nodorum]|nr:hypothetical protein HBH51_149380 [Parastagonospora nodorum]KAH3973778.1 hypothetical protein HBH52_139410 [Parastagonospora nodorum]KAH3998729.1 hypothetical protein HBI10_126410 [Parastagonospora nodorum]KAH4024113.1 hypothetical protein HBI13_083140 [Parastagonospora nodorum]KAH4046387.1 hypothetical protein HBH49_182770 [Parastagonospora nodorum]
MTFDTKRFMTAWTTLTETLILVYPLGLLEDHLMTVDGSPVYVDVPVNLKRWHDVVSFFNVSLRELTKMNDPATMLEESRRVLRGVLMQYEGIDTKRAEKIREFKSVQNWLGGNDEILLVILVLARPLSEAKSSGRESRWHHILKFYEEELIRLEDREPRDALLTSAGALPVILRGYAGIEKEDAIRISKIASVQNYGNGSEEAIEAMIDLLVDLDVQSR